MYIPAIITGIVGLFLLICQLGYFLKDYVFFTNKSKSKTYLIPNIIGTIGSVVLIGLSVTYFILINNQL